ncbi:MAG: hypothetical protein WCD46_11230 [Desulfobacterales bacterium]
MRVSEADRLNAEPVQRGFQKKAAMTVMSDGPNSALARQRRLSY